MSLRLCASLVVLVGACGFQVPGTQPGSDGGDRDAIGGDGATSDAPLDGPAACGACDDGDPCTTDACNGTTCSHTTLALPSGCFGALFGCAGETSCYARCDNDAIWLTAEGSCSGWGGHLATVTSAPEASCIGDVLGTGATRMWIGYRQGPLSPEPAGGWFWISGAPNTFTNWASSQPNNSGDQDCAAAEGPAGRWDDQACLGSRGYICEK